MALAEDVLPTRTVNDLAITTNVCAGKDFKNLEEDVFVSSNSKPKQKVKKASVLPNMHPIWRAFSKPTNCLLRFYNGRSV